MLTGADDILHKSDSTANPQHIRAYDTVKPYVPKTTYHNILYDNDYNDVYYDENGDIVYRDPTAIINEDPTEIPYVDPVRPVVDEDDQEMIFIEDVTQNRNPNNKNRNRNKNVKNNFNINNNNNDKVQSDDSSPAFYDDDDKNQLFFNEPSVDNPVIYYGRKPTKMRTNVNNNKRKRPIDSNKKNNKNNNNVRSPLVLNSNRSPVTFNPKQNSKKKESINRQKPKFDYYQETQDNQDYEYNNYPYLYN